MVETVVTYILLGVLACFVPVVVVGSMSLVKLMWIMHKEID